MHVEIITRPFHLDLYGFSGTAVGKDYVGTAFALMDKMWKTVKSNNVPHKGRNIWVYEPGEKVFAGVELEASPAENVALEFKRLTLDQYAYCKHLGPYNLIGRTGREMRADVERRGLVIISPYVEIYGHWTSDESALETELFMAVE